MYRNISPQLEDCFTDLGQYPGVGEECDPLADLLVPKLASQLVPGSIIVITSGSFASEVVVDAAFKVTCKTIRGALCAQVYLDEAWVADDALRAREAALAAALQAGEVDELGAPILPEVVPPVTPTVPLLVSAIPSCRVYALSRAGIDYTVGLPAFNNPNGVAPLEVEWDLEEVVVPLAGPPLPMPNPVFHVPAPGYSKEQATIGLAAFQILTGRVNYFMENVVAGSSKVDENVALRLKNLDRVSTKMRDLPWVVNNKLLIALMTGNYRQERDTKNFLFFSLLDFCKEGRRWFDISSM